MKKILSYDVSLKKVLRRAILEKNPEMEYIDWLNVVFKINPSERNTVTVISLRPINRTKYSKGTFFRFLKIPLETTMADHILVSEVTNINTLVNKKFSEIIEKLMPVFNGVHFVKQTLPLDTDGVQLPANIDKEVNISLLKLNTEKKLQEVNYDMTLPSVRELISGDYFLRVSAGEQHPLFFGEKIILLK